MVQGDVFNQNNLNKEMDGFDAVHISLSNQNEALATQIIVEIAVQERVHLISYISRCTVSRKNHWFSMQEVCHSNTWKF